MVRSIRLRRTPPRHRSGRDRSGTGKNTRPHRPPTTSPRGRDGAHGATGRRARPASGAGRSAIPRRGTPGAALPPTPAQRLSGHSARQSADASPRSGQAAHPMADSAERRRSASVRRGDPARRRNSAARGRRALRRLAERVASAAPAPERAVRPTATTRRSGRRTGGRRVRSWRVLTQNAMPP